jgi:hypothetical protein
MERLRRLHRRSGRSRLEPCPRKRDASGAGGWHGAEGGVDGGVEAASAARARAHRRDGRRGVCPPRALAGELLPLPAPLPGGGRGRARAPFRAVHASRRRRSSPPSRRGSSSSGGDTRWGARRIHAELRRAGIEPPAVATIHHALRRNHLVVPQAPRRAKTSRRFERELANDLWQIDATQVKLASGAAAWIVDCLDDHARFLQAAIACASPTGEAA